MPSAHESRPAASLRPPSIYIGTKQIDEALLVEESTSLDTICRVEYPHRGKWVLGFASGASKGELRASVARQDLVGVFVPTAPNPTTGFLHFVARRDVIELEMSLEDGVKLIMSGGLVQPGSKPSRQT